MKKILKISLRVLLGVFFILAGISHFTQTSDFLGIVPAYLPYPLALVYISGVFEILGGLGILLPFTKQLAGNGLLLLLLAVFPANINMAMNDLPLGDTQMSSTMLLLRLPLQFILMALIWWCTRNRSEEVTPTPKST